VKRLLRTCFETIREARVSESFRGNTPPTMAFPDSLSFLRPDPQGVSGHETANLRARSQGSPSRDIQGSPRGVQSPLDLPEGSRDRRQTARVLRCASVCAVCGVPLYRRPVPVLLETMVVSRRGERVWATDVANRVRAPLGIVFWLLPGRKGAARERNGDT
jgi:hypothetical protein